MALTEDQVKKVAHLARLALTDEEIPEHAKSLSKILDLVEQMNDVDTKGVEPMSHPLNINQPVREDQVTETNMRQKMQKIAPRVEAGLYLVPKVIEGEVKDAQ